MLVTDTGEGIQVSDGSTPFRLPANTLEILFLDLLKITSRLVNTIPVCLVLCNRSDNPQIWSPCTCELDKITIKHK